MKIPDPYSLAESASREAIYDELGADRSLDTVVLCGISSDMSGCVADGSCDCRIVSLQHTRDEFLRLIHERGKVETRVVVEVAGKSGERLCTCRFDWTIIRKLA